MSRPWAPAYIYRKYCCLLVSYNYCQFSQEKMKSQFPVCHATELTYKLNGCENNFNSTWY